MIPQLEAHYELLVRWNKKINLTTIVDRAEAEQRHYGEGLLLAEQIPAGVATVLDVGSGAGFPGAVIAAARPELRVTLLEGDQRKAAFLKEATRGWPNVKVDARRSTALRPDERWDLIVSRAVRVEDLLPLVPRHADALMILAGEAEAAAVAARTDLTATTLVLPGSERRLLISARTVA